MTHGHTLLVRCDASVAIGTGHAMRCLALAEAWQDAGGSAIFAMAQATPAVEDRLRRENVGLARLKAEPGSADDSQETVALAREKDAAWVVVDGYRFGADYQAALKAVGLRVLLIDDNGHAGKYTADFVLNQNAHAREDFYPSRDASPRLLLGPRYALLRREFTAWRTWSREIPASAQRVLVTMGGSDPDNITERVVQAILAEPSLGARVVVGGSNPHLPRLRELVGGGRRDVQLVENPMNMPELMANSDVAISGAGTTSLEMCFLGLPALLIVLAGNQRPAAAELNARGVVIVVGEGTEIQPSTLSSFLACLVNSPNIRKSLSLRGRELVDGYGAVRVVCALQPSLLQIRPATRADCRLLWDLANDPVVRTSAFSQASISWEDHLSWFESKMQSTTCHILIGEVGRSVAGQVRVEERSNGQGEIDITVAREFRGEGLGSHLIDFVVHQLFASTAISRIHAYILPQNTASQQAFEKAGFQRAGEEDVKGHRALHYVRVQTAGVSSATHEGKSR